MILGSSFTPSVALLVHPSGTVQSIVGCYEFTGSQNNMMPVKADHVICSSVNAVSG